MERVKIAVVGGGASGLILANALRNTQDVLLIERGDRVGKKLSATGNGQGNISNRAAKESAYFSVARKSVDTVRAVLAQFDDSSLVDFFAALGVLCLADERGRIYPAGRQASALTDALRFGLARKGIRTRLETCLVGLRPAQGGFLLDVEQKGEKNTLFAEQVALCTGGKAAKNFGTDGATYPLLQKLGHTVTPLYPSLVQLKTGGKEGKAWRGIRVQNGRLTGYTPTTTRTEKGDILFTEYGVSGDSVFRLSAFLAQEIPSGACRLEIDFLPDVSQMQLYALLREKRAACPELPSDELLFGVVNNQIGRGIMRKAEGDLQRAAALVKAYPLPVTGSLGFDYAQVTKGGVPLVEVDEGLQSRVCKGLYLAGELLDVDGQCGGFNLQWAYASARRIAQTLDEERGQV